MNLQGPYVYQVSVNGEDGYSVLGENGVSHFVSPVTKRGPKLYVFSNEGELIYIGQTVQGMSARIRLGFKANGASGYWGYHWRRTLPRATLHVWCVENINEEDELQALECIEAEVVFMYRSINNQWPKYQTEIHFHESTEEHRQHASTIFREFGGSGV